MLVKFLSFTASVIGTARYKAVFLSCLVLVFSVASIAGMAIWRGNDARNAASTLEKSEVEKSAQQGSPQLGNSRKQAIQGGGVEPQMNEQSTGTAPSTAPSKPTTGTDAASKPLDVTLNTADLVLAPGETSDWLLATVPQGNNVEWTITLSETQGLSIINKTQGAIELRFQIQTEQNTTQAGTYQAILHAKDTQTSAITSKPITIKIL